MRSDEIRTAEDLAKYESWISEELEKGNFELVENPEEASRALAEAADRTFKKIKRTIEKLLFNALKKLPENKNLPLPSFEVEFERSTGEPLSKYERTFWEVLNELVEKKYVVFHNIRMGVLSRGVNFDEWEKKFFSSNPSSLSVKIQNANAVNIAGHTAIQNNNVTPEELLSLLEKLLENPEEGKSLVKKVKEGLETGTSLIDILQKIVALSKASGLT